MQVKLQKTIVWVVFALIAVILLMPLSSASIVAVTKNPSLQFNFVGNWSSTSMEGYVEHTGYHLYNQTGAVSLAITEQNGRVFFGTMTKYYKNGTSKKEEFAGIIDRDGKGFKVAEFIEGYMLGEIIDKDHLEMFYLQDGEPAMAVLDEFVRQKS